MSILSTNSQLVRTNPGFPAWQRSMKLAIRTVDQLRAELNLPANVGDPDSAREFRLFAPREYVARMERGNPRDPLLLQVLPTSLEQETVPGFLRDPLKETDPAGSPSGFQDGLLQKYPGRALVVVTGACAVHCRYCFRRHFPYEQRPQGWDSWQATWEQLAKDTGIEEVILSGGDPLTQSDQWLGQFADRLAEIPHLRRLRIHTRLPLMIPNRVNDALLDWLTGTSMAPFVVIHANHPNELVGEDVQNAIRRLVDAGIPVLNQTVLLRGVNDTPEALVELSRQLINHRVIPYYLHQLDRVAGAAHFEVPELEGRRLVQAMRQRLPGYAVPRYAREEPGRPSKTILL